MATACRRDFQTFHLLSVDERQKHLMLKHYTMSWVYSAYFLLMSRQEVQSILREVKAANINYNFIIYKDNLAQVIHLHSKKGPSESN